MTCWNPGNNGALDGITIVFYSIVSIQLYSAYCSAHQSEALLVRETQRDESRAGRAHSHDKKNLRQNRGYKVQSLL